MTHPAILVENLGKQYQIGSREKRYKTFREALTDLAVAPLRRFRRLSGRSREKEKFWALKDVSFEVRPGEVVGIIGRNGAGKSTLLKMLTKITEPTAGRATIHGRVASLLEVGTGFHHELTGRENIFLNGSILGMTRAEIKRKFDQIVDFSGVEKFLDTPVKRYSSGMQVRLAFAVAAHLDPEILLIDEVLAVGDAEFQKKCLDKMQVVGREGRTVLFVSHQMSAIKSLCSRAIQIDRGKLVADGDPNTVVGRYLKGSSNGLEPQRVWPDPENRPGNTQFRLLGMRVVNVNGELLETYPSSQPVLVEMEFDLAFSHSALCVGFDLIDRHGNVVFRSAHNDRHERDWPALKVGRNRLQCDIPSGLLNFGTYYVAPKVGLHAIAWTINGDVELSFQVQVDHSESPFWNVGGYDKFPGVISPCLRWRAVDGVEPRIASAAPCGSPGRL